MDSKPISQAVPHKQSLGKWPFITIGGIVVVITIGWSVLWFILSDRAKTLIENTLAEFSEQGVDLNCQRFVIGGYPFRLKASCESVTIEVEKATELKAKELRGVALLYNPTHLIFEVESPVTLLRNLHLIMVDWDLIQASINFADLGFSVVLDSAILLSSKEIELLDIESLEAHGRFKDEVELTGFEFNLRVRGLTQKRDFGDLEIPSEIDLDFYSPVDENFLPEHSLNLFAKFIEQGGELRLNQARIKLKETELNLRGNMNFSRAGNLTGRFNLTVEGVEGLIKLFDRQNDNQLALIATIIEGLAKKDKNGVSTALIPFKVDDGFISQIGLIPIPKGIKVPLLPKQLLLD